MTAIAEKTAMQAELETTKAKLPTLEKAVVEGRANVISQLNSLILECYDQIRFLERNTSLADYDLTRSYTMVMDENEKLTDAANNLSRLTESIASMQSDLEDDDIWTD